MNGIINWFARNSVAANLLAVTIIVGGFSSLSSVKQEIFPETDPRMVTVEIVYQGASPEEVEKGVCQPIEEAIEGMDEIKKIRSTATEGMGIVNVELETSADKGKFLDEFKNKVDSIRTFPLQIEEPVFEDIKVSRQVINVAVSGDVSESTLKDYADQVRNDLLALPEITMVKLVNVRTDEVTVELSEWKLREYDITMDEVARAINLASIDIPAGSIRSESGNILIRTKTQKYIGQEFESIVLRSKPDGTVIRVSDVAKVVDGFKDNDLISRFDGKRSAMVQVFRTGNQSALIVANAVKKYVSETKANLPLALSLNYWQDDSSYLKSRLELLVNNGFFGLVLVVGILAMFLRLSLAFWVAVGIVISFLGALWMMPFLGVSINLLSLFGFILVLGIVVDDAIIVSENIHEFQMEGQGNLLQRAIRATQEVGKPVTFAVFTTIAAFIPLITAPGPIGEILGVIPLVVVPTLVFSLIESLFILPCHLGHRPKWYDDVRGVLSPFYKFQKIFHNGVQWFIHHWYSNFLEFALKNRYATWGASLAILIACLGVIAGGWMRFQVFPAVEGDNIAAIVNMPQGTPAAQTEKIITYIEEKAFELQKELQENPELKGVPIFRHTLSSVGRQPYSVTQQEGAGDYVLELASGHKGEVHIELTPSEDRPGTSSEELAVRWRNMVGDLPGVRNVTFTASIFSTGAPIEIQLAGDNYPLLGRAIERLKTELGSFDGVHSIADSYEKANQELQIELKPQGYEMGFTPQWIGQQVRQAFFGAEAQRVQRGREEIRVIVRFPKQERKSVFNLERMMVESPSGEKVPFMSVAKAIDAEGLSTITRVDGKRIVNVTAQIDSSKITANGVLAALNKGFFEKLKLDFPGVEIGFEGEAREQKELMDGILQGYPLAMMIIFALLAIPFKSYLQPFIVMSAIPFGLVGAILGHLIMGMNLTIMSVFGIVALSGVVVNDNLVLVDFINKYRDKGGELLQAVRQAGVVRFRPILLTSMTTFAGLTPLILETSVQAKFLIPMAVSLAFGVMFATSISLVLVPSLYLILNDITRGIGKFFK